MNRIECSSIKIGDSYTACVFFEDGKNMFLGRNRVVKPYHLAAIKKWNIPYLITEGELVSDIAADMQNSDEVEELEVIEELEEI